MKSFLILLSGFIILLINPAFSTSEYEEATTDVFVTKNGDTLRLYKMPQITVIKDKTTLMESIPGSGCILKKDLLINTEAISGNEVFRQAAGVHAVDEEGLGLRANIGIRGLDPSRSRSVLLLEDGVPVALAPYGEPEAYYTPVMELMSGVEIIKGSGSIMFGPQTIGGVINFMTQDPPDTSSGEINVKGGEGGYYSALFQYGNTWGNTGINTTYIRKSGQNIGTSNFRVDGWNTKFNIKLNSRSSLGFKLGLHDEISNSTYVGLTQSMYDAGQYYDIIAPDDRLRIRRYSFSTTYSTLLSPGATLNLTAYAYTTTRNWQRQDFVYNKFNQNNELLPKPTNWTGVTHGDESIEEGAIYMLNSTGNRNRSFEVFGIEPRFSTEYKIAKINNQFDAGIRFLYERAFEQRINGNKKDAPSGELREDEIRTAYAPSGFIQNKTILSKKLSITPGIRVESFNYERNILRGRFNIDGVNVLTDTNILSSNNIFEIIPGIGFNFQLTEKINIYGGVHKGFAPPRIKDAISNEGIAYELDSENSTNYELGFRSMPADFLYLESTVFYMDFDNQIIPVAESAGGSGSGLVNAGKTLHSGVEFIIHLHINKLFKFDNALNLNINATYVNSVYNGDRIIKETNINGNRTPYSPEYLLNSSLTFESVAGWGAGLIANYTSEQFTDELNTINASANGRTGLIPAYHTIDSRLWYNFEKINSVFSLSVKNITDERYIASRRPQGIKVGLARMFIVAYSYRF